MSTLGDRLCAPAGSLGVVSMLVASCAQKNERNKSHYMSKFNHPKIFPPLLLATGSHSGLIELSYSGKNVGFII